MSFPPTTGLNFHINRAGETLGLNYHEGDSKGIMRPVKAMGRCFYSLFVLELTAAIGAVYNLACAIFKGCAALYAHMTHNPVFGVAAQTFKNESVKHLAAFAADVATFYFAGFVTLAYTVLPSYTIGKLNNKLEQYLGTADASLPTLKETVAAKII